LAVGGWQWAVGSGQLAVGSWQWAVGSGEFLIQFLDTLVEMLIVDK